MSPDEIEKHRLETEARAWLKAGYTSKAKVNALMKKIVAKRGWQAATELKEEMRRQYRKLVG